jgi:hypothetical protein
MLGQDYKAECDEKWAIGVVVGRGGDPRTTREEV